jgi:hypothetical protein
LVETFPRLAALHDAEWCLADNFGIQRQKGHNMPHKPKQCVRSRPALRGTARNVNAP